MLQHAEERSPAADFNVITVGADAENFFDAGKPAENHASASGVVTLFARPQSLDRVWVRFGFIPVPESTLPPDLAGRPGAGLYAWRGGTALWTLREHLRD